MPLHKYDDVIVYSGLIPDGKGEHKGIKSVTANENIDEICKFVNKYTILIAHISEEETSKGKLHPLKFL